MLFVVSCNYYLQCITPLLHYKYSRDYLLIVPEQGEHKHTRVHLKCGQMLNKLMYVLKTCLNNHILQSKPHFVQLLRYFKRLFDGKLRMSMTSLHL